MKKQLLFSILSMFILLGTGFNLSAQTISAGSIGTLQVTGGNSNSVFAHSNTSFYLTASLTSSGDNGEAGQTFTNIEWQIKNSSGGFTGVAGNPNFTVSETANSRLAINNLAPGYHTFIAMGETGDEICTSPAAEFTVFVLPPLTVSVTSSNSAIQEFCADDLPENFKLTATAAFDASIALNVVDGLQNPTIGDFVIDYKWYKVADGETFNVATAVAIATTPSTNEYTFNDANALSTGSWNYYAVATYNIKEYGPFTGVLGGTADPTAIKITPKPGKPTITISTNP